RVPVAFPVCAHACSCARAKQASWDKDTYKPGNLMSDATHLLPVDMKDSLLECLGLNPKKHFLLDADKVVYPETHRVPLTAHFMATRMLRYTIATCVFALACWPRMH
ncbi:hypothetical protein OAO87_02775, partial [bacterium]|nr:hypothetical protein [bacterium]